MKYTTFTDVFSTAGTEQECTYDQFVEALRKQPEAPSKLQAPLISLCAYDGTRRGDNITECWGVEVDYDGGEISVGTACEKFRTLGARTIIYTTPSHQENQPRWRALLVFDKPTSHEERNDTCAALNGLFEGALASESFAPSQPFYFGSVRTNPLFEFHVIDGRDVRQCIDGLKRLPVQHRERHDGSVTKCTPADYEHDIEVGEMVHQAIIGLAGFDYKAEEIDGLIAESAMQFSDDPNRVKRWNDLMNGKETARAVAYVERRRKEQFDKMIASLPAPPLPSPVPAPKGKLLVTAAYLAANPSRPAYLVKPFAELGLFGDVFGPPECGKSFVTLGWAFCIAAGIPWLGKYQVTPGDVIYVAGEGHGGIGRRIRAMSDQLNVPVPDNFYVSERAVVFPNEKDWAELFEEINSVVEERGRNPIVIIVDTVARAAPGLDMTTEKDCLEFVKKCGELQRNYGCGVIVVRHTGHENQHRAMGSIAMLGALDFSIRVKRTKAGPSVMSCAKMKDGDKFGDISLKFEKVSWIEGTPDDPYEVNSMHVIEGEMPSEAELNPSKAKGESFKTLMLEILEQASGKMDTAVHRSEYIRLKGGNPETARSSHYKYLKKLKGDGIIVEYAGVLSLASSIQRGRAG